jgi:hypothetical protein
MEESIPESWVGKHVGISVLSEVGELIDLQKEFYFARLGILTHQRVLLKAVYERGILIEFPPYVLESGYEGGGYERFHPWSSVVDIAPPRE